MRKLTKRQVFVRAYIGVMTQAKRSMRKLPQGVNCAYRGDGGLACAIGHCLPDDKAKLADQARDTQVISILRTKDKVLLNNIRHLPSEFLEELQGIHDFMIDRFADEEHFRDEYHKQMERFAKLNKIRMPSPVEIINGNAPL
jgi:hypothetical protein